MEEDIKVLEEFIEKNIKSRLRTELNANELQAIENLIKEYNDMCKLYYDLGSNYCDLDEKNKKLEKENQSLVKQYEYQGALMTNEYLSKNAVKEWFIPKSILQELLEDVDKTPFINKHLKGKYLYDNLKFILQEGDETND